MNLAENIIVIQCINLEIQFFPSLYATATLHWISGHSQSPWVLTLSVLSILRQTPEDGKDVNSISILHSTEQSSTGPFSCR